MDNQFSSSESAGLEPDIQALARALEAMHEPSISLDSGRKNVIRAHVLQRIEMREQERVTSESFALDGVVAWMKRVADEVSISSLAKMQIRERLLSLFDDLSVVSQLQSFKFSPWTIFRRLSATILAASFSLFIVFAFVLQVPVTFAQERAVVQDVSGNATVLRNGGTLFVNKGFELHEGDVLQTGDESKVSVVYFDRSFSRFFEGSRAVFQRLASDDFGAQHDVNVVLQEGSVWSNIFDFVSDSRFRMQARDLVTLASQRATFSLTARDGETALEVYDHTVKVELPSGKAGRTINRGFSVVANQRGDSVRPLNLESSKRAWVQENLAQDKKLLAENEQNMQGVVVGPSNAFQENASLLLAFNSSEKFRLQLSMNERKFYSSLREEPFDEKKNQTDFDALSALAKSVPLEDDSSKKLADASIAAALAAKNILVAKQPVEVDSAAVAVVPGGVDTTGGKVGTVDARDAINAGNDVVTPTVATPAIVEKREEVKPEEEKVVPLPPKLQISQDGL